MHRQRRFMALATAAIFALVFVISAFFIAAESDHACTGHDCHICETLQVCLHFFDNVTPRPAQGGQTVIILFALVLCMGQVSGGCRRHTPVQLKEKLSN